MLKIAIASGKGGTGKTFIATNIAVTLQQLGESVTYLDCDVEEPNGHLFLNPEIEKEQKVLIESPVAVDHRKCTGCKKCVPACHYNAIAVVKGKVLLFPELCHVCGACSLVCPVDAIIEDKREIGIVRQGYGKGVNLSYALLKTGEGGMSPRLIKRVQQQTRPGINIIDAPPGTACTAVESISAVDLVILVADPTPFGLNDLTLAVDMSRKIGTEPVVIINRAGLDYKPLKTYCRQAKLQIMGELPDDRQIAEIYSRGELPVEFSEEYQNLFQTLAFRLINVAQEQRAVTPVQAPFYESQPLSKAKNQIENQPQGQAKPPEIVVISGKGGTGKTSITGALAALAHQPTIADCDVDAADLHLITTPKIKQKGLFSGGSSAKILADRCTGCGICQEECRFEAIDAARGEQGKTVFKIDPLACEGCGVCGIVCPEEAVQLTDAINGEWFVSDTRLGVMAHARLGIAEENSGRLVTLVREKAMAAGLQSESHKNGKQAIIIDGAPGTGCPVIASLTGADYAVVVTEPTVSGVHDMERVLDVARHFGIPTGIIINKDDLNAEMSARIEAIARQHQLEILGRLRYDAAFTDAQIAKQTITEYIANETTDKLRHIWEKLQAAVSP